MKSKKFSKVGFNKIKTHLEERAIKTLVNIQTGNITTPSKGDKIAYTLSAISGTLAYSAGSAFAADPFQQAESLLGEYYGKIFAITTLAAAFLALIAIIVAMFNPKERGASFAWAWLKRIMGCWLLINLLGGLFSIGENLTSGQQFNPGK